ncbi:AQG_2a_G0052300.mRNA.1.CDS.1 [Saccharomyces cerevisiae]|uniref:Vacuolar membrane protein YOR292C n=7 Tax=Saccharomyces cerevisiae TaxID=4932 RepID=YO292_YEAST|eukprot:NP_014935.3 hypothetical protein YOR292C [Saccharomyces cerevisiae S288C]
MPLQLFGRDQIVVHYDNGNMSNDDQNHQSVLGSWTRRAAAALRTLMNKRIQRITLTHWLLLVIWVTSLWKFTSHYRQLYANSAVFATLCTNILLFGISDILAQSIACFYSYHVDPIPQILNDTFHHVQNNRDVENGGGYESDELSIFNDFTSEHSSYTDNDDYPELDRPLATFKTDTFDFFRWGCFMFWGFFISFFQAPWYKFLNFFYTEDPTVVQVFERVLSDQLLYSPISLYCFFMFSNYVMEGGDKDTLGKKIQRLYISTLGCNYLVWPMVQFINFLIMPRDFQAPFSSSVGVVWNCFLSMRNASK